MIRKHSKPWLWVLLSALLSGCAALGPRLEAPKLTVSHVEIIKGDLFEQRFRARMNVQNLIFRQIELAAEGQTLLKCSLEPSDGRRHGAETA